MDLGGVQLWVNGPYWAECNVGAITPEEYGYYFWWGDTVGYKRFCCRDTSRQLATCSRCRSASLRLCVRNHPAMGW